MFNSKNMPNIWRSVQLKKKTQIAVCSIHRTCSTDGTLITQKTDGALFNSKKSPHRWRSVPMLGLEGGTLFNSKNLPYRWLCAPLPRGTCFAHAAYQPDSLMHFSIWNVPLSMGLGLPKPLRTVTTLLFMFPFLEAPRKSSKHLRDYIMWTPCYENWRIRYGLRKFLSE